MGEEFSASVWVSVLDSLVPFFSPRLRLGNCDDHKAFSAGNRSRRAASNDRVLPLFSERLIVHSAEIAPEMTSIRLCLQICFTIYLLLGIPIAVQPSIQRAWAGFCSEAMYRQAWHVVSNCVVIHAEQRDLWLEETSHTRACVTTSLCPAAVQVKAVFLTIVYDVDISISGGDVTSVARNHRAAARLCRTALFEEAISVSINPGVPNQTLAMDDSDGTMLRLHQTAELDSPQLLATASRHCPAFRYFDYIGMAYFGAMPVVCIAMCFLPRRRAEAASAVSAEAMPPVGTIQLQNDTGFTSCSEDERLVADDGRISDVYF
jgi:hypothetical protein